jgi:hypothetical protein
MSRLTQIYRFHQGTVVALSINSIGFDFTFQSAKPNYGEVAMFLRQLRICNMWFQ